MLAINLLAECAANVSVGERGFHGGHRARFQPDIRVQENENIPGRRRGTSVELFRSPAFGEDDSSELLRDAHRGISAASIDNDELMAPQFGLKPIEGLR